MKSRRTAKPKMKSKNLSPKRPKNENDVPSTVEMFKELQASINSHFMAIDSRFDSMDKRFDSLRSEFKSEIHEVKSEIHAVNSKVDLLKSEIHEVKSEIHEVKSEIHEVKSEIHEVKLLNEEQNARNKFVIDQYVNVYEEQRDLKSRIEKLEADNG